MDKQELEYIKTTFEYLRDNTEVANHNKSYAKIFFNNITNSLKILESALEKTKKNDGDSLFTVDEVYQHIAEFITSYRIDNLDGNVAENKIIIMNLFDINPDCR